MIQCLRCNNKIIWKFVYPISRNYSCLVCGNSWNKQLRDTQGQFGTFLGDWFGEEIVHLEECLKGISPDKDWFFFKGKSIFTAWQSISTENLIQVESLDELVYLIAIATQQKN